MGKPYVDSQDLGKLKQQVLMVIVIPKNKTSLIKWKKIEILSSIFWISDVIDTYDIPKYTDNTNFPFENSNKNILSLDPFKITYLLKTLGISNSLQQSYRNNGWIYSIGNGAFVKYNDTPTLNGSVYTMQNQLALDVHFGAKSALDRKSVV